jgi:hypothetical protein
MQLQTALQERTMPHLSGPSAPQARAWTPAVTAKESAPLWRAYVKGHASKFTVAEPLRSHSSRSKAAPGRLSVCTVPPA